MIIKRVTVSLLAVAGLFVGSCTNNPVEHTVPEAPFSITKSEVDRETGPVAQETITQQAQSINEFAVKLYKLLVKEDKNCFFSPYSITSALAMTAAGAGDTTRQQILEALQVDLEGVLFDQAINGIDLSLMNHSSATEGITLNVVNSTWIQNGWDFRIGYLDHLARYYGAGVNLMDFFAEPEESRQIINEWVADQTNDKILDLLPAGSINPSTVLVLTNAIYFLADWQFTFKSELTEDDYFHFLDRTIAKVPMMHHAESGRKVKMQYARMNGVRALDFPYQGDRMVMTVIMPDDSLPSFESVLSADMITELIEALHPESLIVALPKFKFTYGSVSLKNALTQLGMTDAFIDTKADFSGIDGIKDLYIADVVHKAFIAVNEKGTEAAAATGVTFSTTSVNPDIVEFYVNRPFMFVIRDKETGAILFMGRILNPLLEN